MSEAAAERTAARGAVPGALALALAALVIHLALIQPNHPAAATWRALRFFPTELPFVLLALAALPAGARATTLLRGLIAAFLLVSVVLKSADLATYSALGRAFHPFLDLHLLVSAWQLGSGAIGAPLAAAVIAGALVVVAVSGALLWWTTGRWAAFDPGGGARLATGVLAVVAGGLVVAEAGQGLGRWRLPVDPPGSAFAARVAVERVVAYRAAAADLRAFRRDAAADPWADVSPLLDRIGDRDVAVIFIESYGATSLQNPLYAETHRRTLQRIADRLDAEGLAMRSGWLEAPTFGGQSWLSHATFASGLWIDNQRSHGAYLASPRRGLFHLAQRAGFRTAAVMPAITMDWPEGELMGFDTILPADALGYRGLPFNWVTMPDQFTLTAFDRQLTEASAPPLFAQVALISSHAPWTPVPRLIPWDAVGDGSVFDAQATSGDPPEVVWRDPDRIRDQYRRSIDYSLEAAFAYAELHADDPPLLVILGDHQPARLVSQQQSDAVPVHVIGPPDLVAMTRDWDWTPGLLPDDDVPIWPMSAFRDRFLSTFSSGGPAGAG